MDYQALKYALAITITFHLISTFWKPVLSLLWQNLAKNYFTESMKEPFADEEGLFRIPKQNEKAIFFKFPIITQRSLQVFILLSALLYLCFNAVGGIDVKPQLLMLLHVFFMVLVIILAIEMMHKTKGFQWSRLINGIAEVVSLSVALTIFLP